MFTYRFKGYRSIHKRLADKHGLHKAYTHQLKQMCMAQAEHFSLKYVAVLNNNTSGLIAQVFEDNSIVPLPWVVSFFYHHTNETIHINFFQ